MNTWTPLWNSTLDSTLWEEPPNVRIVFLTLLMLRDPDHVVRLPVRVIAKKSNLDGDIGRGYELTEEALKVLAEPDNRSHEFQEFEGRRIKKVEDGFLVLNGEKYLEQMKGLTARLRKTQRQRMRRENERQAAAALPGRALPNERAAIEAAERGDQKTADTLTQERRPSRAVAVVPAPEEVEDNNGEPPTEYVP